MIDYCILGSGISGSTIANILSKKHKVIIIDKAKGIGGRSSNKKIQNATLDHGLQYFSPKTKTFDNFLKKLIKYNILKNWEGNHLDFSFRKRLFGKKIIGKHGNNDLCKYLVKKIKIQNHEEISSIKFKRKFWLIKSLKKLIISKNLIITFPYLQSKKLAQKYLSKDILNLNIKMDPNITLMVSEKKLIQNPISSIKTNNRIISWISNENSKKRFKSNRTYWTIQTSYKCSKKKIDFYKNKKNLYSKIILNEFCKIIGAKKRDLQIVQMHGWKYSYNRNKTKFKSYWDKKLGLGICGDWFIGPNAESAWLSALNLSSKIKKTRLRK